MLYGTPERSKITPGNDASGNYWRLKPPPRTMIFLGFGDHEPNLHLSHDGMLGWVGCPKMLVNV